MMSVQLPVRSAPGDDRLRGKRVLMMEDDYFISEFVVQELARLGAEIIGPFPSVRDGLRAIGKQRVLDGAVLDVKLRDEMVFPIADVLRERGIPFVFHTAFDHLALPLRYRNVPFCDKLDDGTQIADALFANARERRPKVVELFSR